MVTVEPLPPGTSASTVLLPKILYLEPATSAMQSIKVAFLRWTPRRVRDASPRIEFTPSRILLASSRPLSVSSSRHSKHRTTSIARSVPPGRSLAEPASSLIALYSHGGLKRRQISHVRPRAHSQESRPWVSSFLLIRQPPSRTTFREPRRRCRRLRR
jgi:hypothetical protein